MTGGNSVVEKNGLRKAKKMFKKKFKKVSKNDNIILDK